MSDDLKTYTADHELAVLLKAAAAAGKRLRVKAEGETFDIEVKLTSRSRDIWEGYDPEAARQAWRDVAGMLPDLDADALIRQIKEEREQDTPARKFP